ncbi:MAG: DNA-deoxyinosine glycosylase [Candidatus Dadabacteria bacterium]|nr:MAG: DNA-deoxyinosine glycosylase [Candidatus Dadabacteria bacterium]
MKTTTDHRTLATRRDEAFAPVFDAGARALILGSMPGRASLDARQYYAHPRNAFWPIMASICGFPPELGYSDRCDALRACGVALWDVLKSCVRPGSLDSNIDHRSAEVNDFGSLFDALTELRLIVFNGAMAEQLFRRYVVPLHAERLQTIDMQRLPSTSPAMASLNLEQKRVQWMAALGPLCSRTGSSGDRP